jgi:hypothetical protein
MVGIGPRTSANLTEEGTMAARKQTTEKKSLFKRLMWLVMLLTGGGAGVGGMELTDYPILSHLLGLVREQVAGDATPIELVREGLVSKLDSLGAFRRRGVFEVRVSRIAVGEESFSKGQTLNLQARVWRLAGAEGGKDEMIWTSRSFGDRLAVVGKDDLTAGWPDRPFTVEWEPGQKYRLEVWNVRGLRASRLYEITADDPTAFPLSTGDMAPETLADGKPPAPPDAYMVKVESRRTGDLPDTGSASIADRGGRSLR